MVFAFESFWDAYPRHEDKKKAREVWFRKKPDIEQVLNALEWQVQSAQWVKGFIPHAHRYIRDERYNDEPPQNTSQAALEQFVRGGK